MDLQILTQQFQNLTFIRSTNNLKYTVKKLMLTYDL